MPQLVTRIHDDLAELIDELIAEGVVESRSDAVRQGLESLVDRHRRYRIGAAIVAGYRAQPQADDPDLDWADQATAAMIAEESW